MTLAVTMTDSRNPRRPADSHLQRGRRHQSLLDVVHLHLVVLAVVDDDDVRGVAVVDDSVRLDARHARGVEGPLILPGAERHHPLHRDLPGEGRGGGSEVPGRDTARRRRQPDGG